MTTERYERGLAARKAVLGEEYVERNLAEADDFNQGFQELLTEFAWGGAWANDTLSFRERSLINLGMIAGLNRMEEFEIHFMNNSTVAPVSWLPTPSGNRWHFYVFILRFHQDWLVNLAIPWTLLASQQFLQRHVNERIVRRTSAGQASHVAPARANNFQLRIRHFRDFCLVVGDSEVHVGVTRHDEGACLDRSQSRIQIAVEFLIGGYVCSHPGQSLGIEVGGYPAFEKSRHSRDEFCGC